MTLTLTRATAPSPISAPAEPVPAPPRSRRPLVFLLVAGWLAQVGIRLWFARGQAAPAAYPDEAGYLFAARWLAGGPGADLSGGTFYQGGYSLLLVPVFWVTHDPQTVYRLVLGINAAVGAGIFLLGYLLLRRLQLPARVSYGAAWAAALFPAGVFFGQFALTDAILPVLVAGWLLALHSFVRSGGTAAGIAASALAAQAYATHSRGNVIVAVHAAVIALALLRRWAPRRTALIAMAMVVAGCAAAKTLNDALLHALYPQGSRDLGDLLWTRLTTLDGQARALSCAAGQLWYLTVSTWGLGAVGLVATGWALMRSRRDRVMAGVLLATTLGIGYASAAALPDENRVGNYAYGRYLACVAVVYALIGLTVLLRGKALKPVGAGVVLLCGTGLWTIGYAGDRLQRSIFVSFDFPETGFLTGDWTSFHPVRASLVALAMLVVLALLAVRSHRAVVIGLAAVNLAAMTVIAGHLAMPRGVPAVPPGATAGGVAIDPALSWRIWIRQAYQIWWTRVERLGAGGAAPRPGVCTVLVPLPADTPAGSSWPARPEGWRPVATGPGWAAWRATGCGRQP